MAKNALQGYWCRKYKWIGLLLAATCLVSCEIGDEPACLPATDRVLLVYLGGDNNLSQETYQKIEAIKEGLLRGSVNGQTLIYHDPVNRPPVLTELKIHNGEVLSDTVTVYGEDNSASAGVFASVIHEVKAKYPAKGYGLLLFSHGSGWLPQGALESPRLRSVVMDGKAEMEIADFARAIPDGAFDYIVFEACFMGGIEVAYELKDKTAYIFASSAEIVSPGFTTVYPESLSLLWESNPAAFAEQAFDYFDRQEGEMRSATFSVIRTEGLQALAEFIAAHCRFDRAVDIQSVQHFDRNRLFRLFFDFEDYYSRLLDLDEQRSELQSLINRCVVWKNATPSFLIGSNGFYVHRHSGLTVYIPQDGFPELNLRNEGMGWWKAITNAKCF